MSSEAIAELVAKIGFNIDDSGLNKLKSTLKNIQSRIKEVGRDVKKTSQFQKLLNDADFKQTMQALKLQKQQYDVAKKELQVKEKANEVKTKEISLNETEEKQISNKALRDKQSKLKQFTMLDALLTKIQSNNNKIKKQEEDIEIDKDRKRVLYTTRLDALLEKQEAEEEARKDKKTKQEELHKKRLELMDIKIDNAKKRRTKDLKDIVSSISKIGMSFGIGSSLNATMEKFYSIFQSLDTARVNLMSGRNVNEAWYLLGLNPAQDPRKVFDDILKRMRVIKDEGMRRTRAQEIGFNADFMTALLRINPSGENIQRLVKVFRDIKASIFEITTRVSLSLAPALDVIRNIIRNVTDIFNDFGKDVLKVYLLFKGFQVLTNPFVAIATALEDIYGFYKGWDSVTESLLIKLGLAQSTIEKIRNFVRDIFQYIQNIIKATVNLPIKLFNWFSSNDKTTDNILTKDNFSNYIEQLNKLQDIKKIARRNIREFHKMEFQNIQNFNIDGAKDVNAIVDGIKNEITGDKIFNNFQNELNITGWGLSNG